MNKNEIPYKIYLEENEIPTSWYNVRADMKNKPAPLIHPGTLQPLKFEDMQPIFCDELIRQELDNDTAYIPIPEEVLNFYKMYRPSPLTHAKFLEQALDTPAKIFYKFEGIAYLISRKRNLIKGLVIHKCVEFSVIVQITHIYSVNTGSREFFRRTERSLKNCSGNDIFILCSYKCCTLARFYMLKFYDLAYISINFKGNAVFEITSGNHINWSSLVLGF